jgi:folate-dependent tRNA-U54 methylase TrmFO/GidA
LEVYDQKFSKKELKQSVLNMKCAERIGIIAKLQKLLKNSLHKNTHINSQCLTNKTYSKKLNLKSINKVGYLIGIEASFIWARVA